MAVLPHTQVWAFSYKKLITFHIDINTEDKAEEAASGFNHVRVQVIHKKLQCMGLVSKFIFTEQSRYDFDYGYVPYKSINANVYMHSYILNCYNIIYNIYKKVVNLSPWLTLTHWSIKLHLIQLNK